jgi:paraquat-inducible protein A
VLSLFVRATLDERRVWRAIGDEAPLPAGGAAEVIRCLGCDLLTSRRCEGRRCRRCGAALRSRRPDGVSRALALLAAALLLYFPANIYPIATIPIGLNPTSYTVFGGIVDLVESHLEGLAVLVFCASFAIPLLKIVGLGWCALSAARRSATGLVAKTRVYRLLEEIGRWSMVDPFTISCFVPVLHFNSLLDGRAEAAATPFAAVVILTTLAVKVFDPRRMWDAATQPQ